MSSIRVTYSGLISFIISIASIFTGLIFTLIVTRQLSQDEFGTWSLIGVLISYVLIISPITTMWVTREIARGTNSGRTAIISSGLFSLLGITSYVVLLLIMSLNMKIDLPVILISVILIPTYFFRNVLTAISYGYKPHWVEYNLLIFELAKIPLGFGLVYVLDLGLVGAILTIFGSTITSLSYLFFKLRGNLIEEFSFNRLKKWLKLFWIPTYPQINRIIYNLDIVIFTLISGAVGAVAYWGAAIAISQSVVHASKINIALYPKLLGGGKKEIFQENFSRVLYFSFPMCAMAIVFAEPGLFTLNPLYREGVSVVIFLVPLIFQFSLVKVFSSVLTGVEKVDMNEKASLKSYLKSKLFFIPTLALYQALTYSISLVVVLLIINDSVMSEVKMVETWALIALITHIPYTSYLYILVRREISPSFDKYIIFKYLLTSIGSFGIVYYLIKENLVYKESIFEFLPSVIPYVIFAVGLYLGITYLIDQKTRKLFKSAISEIKTMTKGDKND